MTNNIGTARFMAPEVELNSVYDHRADLYSLGLVLYYLRNYERMPFETGTNSYNTSNSNSPQRKHILGTEPLPPPIQASPALASVILKACSFEPKDRYASARAMKEALQKVLQSAPPTNTPPPPSPHGSLFPLLQSKLPLQ